MDKDRGVTARNVGMVTGRDTSTTTAGDTQNNSRLEKIEKFHQVLGVIENICHSTGSHTQTFLNSLYSIEGTCSNIRTKKNYLQSLSPERRTIMLLEQSMTTAEYLKCSIFVTMQEILEAIVDPPADLVVKIAEIHTLINNYHQSFSQSNRDLIESLSAGQEN